MSTNKILSESTTRLSKNRLKNFFDGEPMPEFIIFEHIPSTNTYAKEYARNAGGLDNGIFIASDSQTSGRGRLGKSFLSDMGRGLYFTYLFKPKLSREKIIHLTTCAATVVCSVLDELIGSETSIKWVNDIYLGGKKLAGILTEGEFDSASQSFSYAAVGIGINLYDIPFPDELSEIATSVEAQTGIKLDKNLLLARLAIELTKKLSSAEDFIDEYRKKCFVVGKRVKVICPSGSYFALAEAVGNDGELAVRLDTGERKLLFSGEISVKSAE